MIYDEDFGFVMFGCDGCCWFTQLGVMISNYVERVVIMLFFEMIKF